MHCIAVNYTLLAVVCMPKGNGISASGSCPICQHAPANIDSGVLYPMLLTLHGRSINACCSCSQPSCSCDAFRHDVCGALCQDCCTMPSQGAATPPSYCYFRQTPAEPWLRWNSKNVHHWQRQSLLPCSPGKEVKLCTSCRCKGS